MSLWLLMSGLYKILLIAFGISSVLLVMLFLHRMNIKDGYELKPNIWPMRTVKYLGWLLVEIMKSNWAVVKILLSKELRINQKFIEITFSQKSDLAKVMFANSITLTPGTVTVETDEKGFLVHVLNRTKTTEEDLNNMNDMVTGIEK